MSVYREILSDADLYDCRSPLCVRESEPVAHCCMCDAPLYEDRDVYNTDMNNPEEKYVDALCEWCYTQYLKLKGVEE